MVQASAARRAKVVLIPVVSEGGPEAAQGIQAVLEASLVIEAFDEELRADPFAVGIDAMRAFWDEPPFANAEQAVGIVLDHRQFALVLAGERTLSLGAVRAAWKRHRDLAVVQVAAHAQLRSEVEGDPYGPWCLAARLGDWGLPVVQVGVRSLSRAEWDWYEAQGQDRHRIFWSRQFRAHCPEAQSWDVPEVLAAIEPERPLYLSIDIGGLDAPMAAMAEHPEPGGLGWFALLRLLRALFERHAVVACDLSGFGAEASPAASAPLARLLHKIVGYKFYGGRG
ncbi:arginase family protein [Gloeobacter violaceus]|uniref:Gll3725 protein n=1 Tax=Gloeobacter violaceus (strain ATCC 29082 / PCC 7421) TaxID=251221 RepID=Q7NF02_GLOVI|nr:arginase family protein [Gloeobacter violaceus]BAC91666.1 gll3725 [Gloeobacter violaceus PCC 7421]